MIDEQLMQLFPGRTLEELDEIDDARLYKALEARNIGRQCRVIEGWFEGTTTPEEFQKVDQDIAKEFMKLRKG